MKKLERGNLTEHGKVHTKLECNKKKMVLSDLVTIFTEEAYKICKNKETAKLIALKSLQEYIKKNTNNLKITL